MPTPARLAIISFALLAALPLHAGVVEHDFLIPGDRLLTYDDVNHREWLDLPYTFGMELSAIKSQMETGGVLESFEFATLEDVEPLALSAEVQWSNVTSYAVNPNLLPNSQEAPMAGNPVRLSPATENFIDLLGAIFSIAEGTMDATTGTKFTIKDRSSYGQIAQSTTNGEPLFEGTRVSISYGETLIQFINGTSNLTQNGSISTVLNAPNTNGPFWLYRTAVPEPTSIALLTLGVIAGLSTRNRRC